MKCWSVYFGCADSPVVPLRPALRKGCSGAGLPFLGSERALAPASPSDRFVSLALPKKGFPDPFSIALTGARGRVLGAQSHCPLQGGCRENPSVPVKVSL